MGVVIFFASCGLLYAGDVCDVYNILEGIN